MWSTDAIQCTVHIYDCRMWTCSVGCYALNSRHSVRLTIRSMVYSDFPQKKQYEKFLYQKILQ